MFVFELDFGEQIILYKMMTVSKAYDNFIASILLFENLSLDNKVLTFCFLVNKNKVGFFNKILFISHVQ